MNELEENERNELLTEIKQKMKSRKVKRYLLFSALGAAALFGSTKIPYVRNVAFPYLADFAIKNWDMLKERFPMLQKQAMQDRKLAA
jgi:hypothetical protein